MTLCARRRDAGKGTQIGDRLAGGRVCADARVCGVCALRGRNAWRSVVISRIIRSENRGYAGRVACGWGVTTANVLTSSARAQSVRPAVRYVVIRGA